MHLSRIRVKNFRNFRCLDVKLGPKCVVVGENNVGKTNLIFALRLILDPKLSDNSRQLREEDFWDGLKDPVKHGAVIEAAIEIQGFKDDRNLFAILQKFCIDTDPVTALLTYRFRPRALPLPDQEVSIRDYEFVVFGGVDEKNKIDFHIRKWVPIEVLPALRDAERDLASWRQSPLRPLLDRLEIRFDTLDQVARDIDKATDQLLAEDDVRKLDKEIQSRLSLMVGSVHQVDPTLGFAPTTPERLTRSLRMFGDGIRKRPLGEMSLGIDNLLYLLLFAVELERKTAAAERAKTILAIEEPESHLHPHLQRLVFGDFLRRETPVILTTHSPHIASVAPLENVVLLRENQGSRGSEGSSIFQANLNDQEVVDLERYLDATRSEMLFARGVILVEGAAELFLIPAIAEVMGTPLDQHGITVCSVHGVDFIPYTKLLGPLGLNVPFVVLTDADWYKNAKGEKASRGLRRAVRVSKAMRHSKACRLNNLHNSRLWAQTIVTAKEIGVFVGNSTLESDLFNSGLRHEIVDSLEELNVSPKVASRLRELANQGSPLGTDGVELLLTAVSRIGKGRVAQRLASRVVAEKTPTYVREGIQHLIEVLSE